MTFNWKSPFIDTKILNKFSDELQLLGNLASQSWLLALNCTCAGKTCWWGSWWGGGRWRSRGRRRGYVVKNAFVSQDMISTCSKDSCSPLMCFQSSVMLGQYMNLQVVWQTKTQTTLATISLKSWKGWNLTRWRISKHALHWLVKKRAHRFGHIEIRTRNAGWNPPRQGKRSTQGLCQEI